MSDAPLEVNVQTSDYNNIPTKPLELIGWIISWMIWAYAWAMFAALSIFFVESKGDFFATLENLLILVIYPFYAVFIIGYTKILYPIYCLFSQCLYGIDGWLFYGSSSGSWLSPISKITGWIFHKGNTQPPYVPPKYCGGKNSSGCKSAPGDPGLFTAAYMFCGHRKGQGGMCEYSCQQ